ncbi:MAG TPA: carboxypeptidase-like regulatory domain-containing protein [Eudoraea sp.]|nr:carboxypeptidase-like regulatory domain-containing protein [Eudoraea sp.]
MKRFVTGVLLFGLFFASAQRETPNISISFEDAAIGEVLAQIEEITDFHFYYVAEWLGNGRISGNYRDIPLDDVLEDIFRETILNFYITRENSVVLTRSNLIIDHLPEDFFGQKVRGVTETGETEVSPLFYNEEQEDDSPDIQTVRIGKQDGNNTRRRYRLSGIARNAETGKPVPEMAIVVRGKNIGTATDTEGRYEMELPAGVNILETSALGIEGSLKKVIIYDDGQLNFDLNESFEVLDEVVVKGNRDRNVEQAATGVTLLEVEKIKTIPLVLGERDILKAAVTLPGISTAGEGAAGFNVRGGRTDQNLILLDNAVVYNPTHFFGIFSALNPFTSGDVNIYKGSIPAEYGGRLSSVFDINTRDANTKEFAGEASIGPVTSNLVLETPILKDKAAILVGGRATYSDWILRSLDEPELSNSKASFYDVIAKYNHTINENNELKATGYFSRDEFSITSDSLYDYSNRLFSLRWDHKFNEKNTGSLLLSNSEYQFNIGFDGESNADFDLGYKINESEFKWHMKYLGDGAHKLSYGLASKLYLVDPGDIRPKGTESIVTPLNIPREKGLESGIFISDSYTVNEKLLIDAGLRYSFYAALGKSTQRIYQENAPRNDGTLVENREFDNNEVIKTYGGLEARVSARYFLMPDFSVKAGFNNVFQYIHTLSNNTTASPTDTWKLSDFNIKPQEANQWSLGFYKNFDGNTYELSLEGYFKQAKNLLDYKVGAQLLLNETIETEVLQGDGKAYGVEFLIKKNEGRLNGWLGYSYARSFVKLDSPFPEERVNGGEFFPSNFDKPHDVSLVANYKFTRRFSASMNFVYQTGRPVTYPIGSYDFNNAEYVFYSDRNEFRIPDYYRLDLSFNMEGNHKIKKFAHSFWNFSIYNVLGRNNPYSIFFVTENGELKALQSSIFAIPVPTVTYNFKF